MTRLVVVTGSAGSPSSTRLLGERLAEATVAALDRAEADTPLRVTRIEVRTLGHDLVEHATTRRASAALQEAVDAVLDADGVIAVTPVYNGSYSGLFKLFFDAFEEDALNGRPVLLGATGGTVRHSFVIDHALVPLFYSLKAPVAPHGVYAATQDWEDGGTRLNERIGKAAAGFAELVTHCSPHKGPGASGVPDFNDLLRG